MTLLIIHHMWNYLKYSIACNSCNILHMTYNIAGFQRMISDILAYNRQWPSHCHWYGKLCNRYKVDAAYEQFRICIYWKNV